MSNENNIKVTSSSFPVFTLIAGLLLVAKLTVYPEISWWIILGVWTIPLSIVLLIMLVGVAIVVAGSLMLIIGFTLECFEHRKK